MPPAITSTSTFENRPNWCASACGLQIGHVKGQPPFRPPFATADEPN